MHTKSSKITKTMLQKISQALLVDRSFLMCIVLIVNSRKTYIKDARKRFIFLLEITNVTLVKMYVAKDPTILVLRK